MDETLLCPAVDTNIDETLLCPAVDANIDETLLYRCVVGVSNTTALGWASLVYRLGPQRARCGNGGGGRGIAPTRPFHVDKRSTDTGQGTQHPKP